MAKCVTHKRLKRVAEKYGISQKWIFVISRNGLTFGCLRKLAAKVLLCEVGVKGEVSFAKSSPILSPYAISKLTGIPPFWFYYHGCLSAPLWRWKMGAWRLPRGRREKVLQALADFERRVDDLAWRIWRDAISENSESTLSQGKEVKINGDAEND